MSDAKEFLKRANLCDAQINTKLEELRQLREMVLKVTPTLKDDVVSSSGPQDKLGDAVASIVDLQSEINEQIDSYIDMKKQINAAIDQLSDGDFVTVLRKRYILNEEWASIANQMHYDLRTVYNIHGRALLAVEKILENQLNSSVTFI